jgi:molecular chaperone DnaK (HSP70)
MVADDHELGLFSLSGIPPAKRGVPQIGLFRYLCVYIELYGYMLCVYIHYMYVHVMFIFVLEVTFEIDSNGIMSVTAADLGTKNKKSHTIKNDNRYIFTYIYIYCYLQIIRIRD